MRALHPSRGHATHTPYRHSQMLSPGSPTKKHMKVHLTKLHIKLHLKENFTKCHYKFYLNFHLKATKEKVTLSVLEMLIAAKTEEDKQSTRQAK